MRSSSQLLRSVGSMNVVELCEGYGHCFFCISQFCILSLLVADVWVIKVHHIYTKAESYINGIKCDVGQNIASPTFPLFILMRTKNCEPAGFRCATFTTVFKFFVTYLLLIIIAFEVLMVYWFSSCIHA